MAEEISKNTEEDTEEKSFLRVIVHSFFIIPFLIAVFCLLLFGAVNLLTSEKRTAYDYLEDVKTGGLTKRWQGAFELSKILANKSVNDDLEFSNQLISAFEQSIHDDPRVRQYLALAMGRTQNPAYVTPLIASLTGEKEENLPSSIYALGMLANDEASKILHAYLDHTNARVRSITAVSLGNISSDNSIPFLQKALNDSEPNVQWGAAISLAQMGNISGKEIILNLLNRKYLSNFAAIDNEEQTNLMLSAIRSCEITLDEDLKKRLTDLSKNDRNMKIRSAAMKVITQ